MRLQPTTTRTMKLHGLVKFPSTVAGMTAALLILPTLASAQNVSLEEIIVTAQKREENLQQTAIAVTAVTAETLANVNADTFYDIARLAPSVQIGGLQGNQLVIRGVGQQQPGLFSEAGAAIYVDGIYRPRFALNSVNFTDVERMEVLRGPQGTLYGKNAVGGAVNIITRTGGNDFGADIQGQYGSRNHVKLDGSINLPLVQDTLVARLSYNSNQQDGYIHNLNTGEYLSDTNYYAAHGSLRWNATDAFTMTLRSDYFHQDQKGLGYVLLIAARTPTATFAARDAIVNSYRTSNPYENYAGPDSKNQINERGASLTMDWKLGPGALKSITAYREFTSASNADSDGTPPVVRSSPTSLFEHFWSEEVQYNVSLFDKLDWTTGAFYYKEVGRYPTQLRDNNDVTSGIPSRTSTNRSQDAISYALFSEATYTAFDKLGITLGARYSAEEKSVTAQGYDDNTGAKTADVAGSNDWKSFTPKLTVQYQFTPDLMSYATVSKGFKAGGFNTSVSYFQPYDPEYVWNYELGLKSEWFDRRVRANLTAYQMDYSDIQLNAIVVLNAATNSTTPVVANSGDARIRGGEAELTFAATEHLLLNAAFGVNDFKYVRLSPSASGVTLSNVLPNSPKYSANGGAEYSFALGTGKLALRGDYSYRSKSYFDPGNTELAAQPAYGLYSARITYSSDNNWSVFAYGSNLADKYYRIAGFAGSTGVTSTLPGPPREIGAGFRLSFGK